MLVWFVSVAVLLAGCVAPVTRPTLSHPANLNPDVRTPQPGRRELPREELVTRTPDYPGGVHIPWDSIWTDEELDMKTACLVAVVLFVVVTIATATVWR